MGTDLALTMSTSDGRPLELTWWDLWFSVVAQRKFQGDLDAVARELREKRKTIFGAENAVAKLSHLRDLQKRLKTAGIDVEAVVAAAGDLVTAAEVRRARGRVLEGTERQFERSPAMHQTPRKRGWAFALRGFWPQFPVSPEPYAEEILTQFKTHGFYSAEQSFGVSKRLDRYAARGEELANAGEYAQTLALLRGWLTATLEVVGMTDDSYGELGTTFDLGFRQYLALPWEETGIDQAAFFHDLLTLLIWEDYGMTSSAVEGYFAKLPRGQGELCQDHLRRQVEELRAEDLDYQSEKALTLLGQVATEQERFEQFEELAREMGSRHWRRIIRLADRAVKKRKRDLAKRVFEAALTPGMHHDFLQRKYEQLMQGQWSPDPRK